MKKWERFLPSASFLKLPRNCHPSENLPLLSSSCLSILIKPVRSVGLTVEHPAQPSDTHKMGPLLLPDLSQPPGIGTHLKSVGLHVGLKSPRSSVLLLQGPFQLCKGLWGHFESFSSSFPKCSFSFLSFFLRFISSAHPEVSVVPSRLEAQGLPTAAWAHQTR